MYIYIYMIYHIYIVLYVYIYTYIDILTYQIYRRIHIETTNFCRIIAAGSHQLWDSQSNISPGSINPDSQLGGHHMLPPK
jgi:hypothetical protein